MSHPGLTMAPPAPPRTRDWRPLGLSVVAGVVAVGVAYLTVHVPIAAPVLARPEATRYWIAAALGALVVACGVLLVIIDSVRGRSRPADGARAGAGTHASANRADRADRAGGAGGAATAGGAELHRAPRSLGFERVPRRAVIGAAVLSLATIPPALALGVQLWIAWLAILAPWIPLVAVEVNTKCGRYGVFGAFVLLLVLQILHMIEHGVQVGQLVASTGDLAHSHGILGQLDFELVHFITDTTVWVSLGMLITMLGGRRIWLWTAFAAASLHQVEHFYLFWLYLAHNATYQGGGFAGIMGNHGMIGSPLDRPYLHFTYNVIVLVPMAIAVWDEARRLDSLSGSRSATP